MPTALPVASYTFAKAPYIFGPLHVAATRRYFRDSGSQCMREPGQRSLLTVPEACEELRISRWTLYALINRRRLATIKIGRRRLIARAAIEGLIAKLEEEGTL